MRFPVTDTDRERDKMPPGSDLTEGALGNGLRLLS